MTSAIRFAAVAAVALTGLSLTSATQAQQTTMSFFVTSVGKGNGADLGGLVGADAHCQALAKAAGSTETNWHAYLSTTEPEGSPASTRVTALEKDPGGMPRALSWQRPWRISTRMPTTSTNKLP